MPRSALVMISAALHALMGLLSLATIGSALYAIEHGELRRRQLFGTEFRELGGPFEEWWGLRFVIVGAFVVAATGVAYLVATGLLWRHRRSGATLALLTFPIGLFFWLGFAVPIYLVLGPLAAVSAFAAWRVLGAEERATTAG